MAVRAVAYVGVVLMLCESISGDYPTNDGARGLRARRQWRYNEKLREPVAEADNYLRPYWVSGEWVFYRPSTRYTSAPGQKATPSPRPARPAAHLGGGTYTPATSPTTGRHCDQLCLLIMLDFGPVCGARLRYVAGWHYEYVTFSSVCHLEATNCRLPQANVLNDKHSVEDFVTLYKGECRTPELPKPEDPSGYPGEWTAAALAPAGAEALAQRAASWQGRKYSRMFRYPLTVYRRAATAAGGELRAANFGRRVTGGTWRAPSLASIRGSRSKVLNSQ